MRRLAHTSVTTCFIRLVAVEAKTISLSFPFPDVEDQKWPTRPDSELSQLSAAEYPWHSNQNDSNSYVATQPRQTGQDRREESYGLERRGQTLDLVATCRGGMHCRTRHLASKLSHKTSQSFGKLSILVPGDNSTPLKWVNINKGRISSLTIDG